MPAIQPQSEPSGSALILVADPDPYVQDLERYFLEQAGFEVELVGDGEQGLALARARLPRIVITEILLAKKDGLSVCRAIKTDPVTRLIPVLVLSVLAAEDRARQAGADAFLRKPLDNGELIDAVLALLAQQETGARNGTHQQR